MVKIQMTNFQQHRIEMLWIKAFSMCCHKGCGRNLVSKEGFFRVMESIINELDDNKRQRMDDALLIGSLRHKIATLESKLFVSLVQQPVAIIETDANQMQLRLPEVTNGIIQKPVAQT